jgi:hypothetical protein
LSWRFASAGAVIVALGIAVTSLEAQTGVRPEIRFESTTLSLASTANPSTFGTPVTLIATITPSTAPGSVTFYAGTTILGTAALSGGYATLTTVFLPAGIGVLHAYYGGYATVSPPFRYDASTSNSVKQTVDATPVRRVQYGEFPGRNVPIQRSGG